ncbi:MAG: threonine--tRNA ligase [Bacilli bacterium]|nr:threonine--tRNA ligase [Bacilli bacterium]
MKIILNNKKININSKDINIENVLLKFVKNQNEIIAYKINGELFDLSNYIKINENDRIELIDKNSDEAKAIYNHSGAHLLAHAVHRLYPTALFAIGPNIETGFYYDIDFVDNVLSENDFSKIEKEMQKIANEKIKIERKIISKQEANNIFKNNKYKLELIKQIKEDISIYKQNDFVDLCIGPHVPNTSFLKHFKILSLSGSYWQGNSLNKQLTRIYGIVARDDIELKKYLDLIEKQKEINHKKIGKNLQLFMFSEYGPGLPFWLPNGIILKNELKKFWIDIHKKYGYSFIETPIILSKQLWLTSGHWRNYKKNMYLSKVEKEKYAIKPMNCPGCILVYKNAQHSYKELPIKLGELGLVHRHEASGALNGLFRVREFTQDDAHIFCSSDQLEQEIIEIIEIFNKIYSLFNLNYHIEISTRPDKYIGDIKSWNKSEQILKEACKKFNKKIVINNGGGAFYGPKIDFKLKDSMERTWQCGTIQLDMNLPKIFDLYYINKKNERVTPIMLHRAAFGSIERFIGIILEHFNGILPLWLAPEQVRILTVNNQHIKYAENFLDSLKKKNIRATIDFENSLSYRLKKSQVNKIPYTIVIGNNEISNNSITYRMYSKTEQFSIYQNKFIKMIVNNIKKKK